MQALFKMASRLISFPLFLSCLYLPSPFLHYFFPIPFSCLYYHHSSPPSIFSLLHIKTVPLTHSSISLLVQHLYFFLSLPLCSSLFPYIYSSAIIPLPMSQQWQEIIQLFHICQQWHIGFFPSLTVIGQLFIFRCLI